MRFIPLFHRTCELSSNGIRVDFQNILRFVNFQDEFIMELYYPRNIDSSEFFISQYKFWGNFLICYRRKCKSLKSYAKFS